MNKKDVLFEIGCEEIPARFVEAGKNQLGEKISAWLLEQRISFGAVETFATPRRLSVIVKDVAEKQEDLSEEVKGPAIKIAQTPEGTWSKAAEGFAKKNGVAVDQLFLKEVKGETYVFAQKHQVGASTLSLLTEGLAGVISSLTFPKMMRWGSYKEKFIRPIRWMVALFGNEVVPVSWAGVTASNISRGHRVLGKDVVISNAQAYESLLAQQAVLVRPEQRKQMILEQINHLEKELGWTIPIDQGLLEEVTYLVETPTTLVGKFEEEFLPLPKSVLITTMREHQRYFPVESSDGKLLPYFVTVRNGDATRLDIVARGNEKVLRARLSDARFFFEEDQKASIDSFLRKLDNIVYQEELGTVTDRVHRVRDLAVALGEKVQFSKEEQTLLDRAAQICKFDLATQMVGEFTELEGYMGRVYATIAGEEPQVANAVEEHYQPRFSGDKVPVSTIGAILSIADKMDAIVASFGIGIQPTGSQDPYGLRRKAAGIIQILLQHNLLLSLTEAIHQSVRILKEKGLVKVEEGQLINDLYAFFNLRMKTALQEEAIRYDVIDAVIGQHIEDPQLTRDKAHVMMKQVDRETFKLEVEAFTRVANLASKAIVRTLDASFLTDPAETSLYTVYESVKKAYQQAKEQRDSEAMFTSLSQLVTPIHHFFDRVMVMVEDEHVRTARLALLAELDQLIQNYANFNSLVFA